jgi:O-antigen/teichoic acid export membrane protein
MDKSNQPFKQFLIKSFLILASGTLLSQIVQILAYPFITRFFTPEDFGLKAFFLTIVAIAVGFSTGKYEEAISIPKTDEEAVDLIGLSFILSVCSAIFFSIFFYFFRDHLFEYQTENDFLIYVILVPLGIIAISLVNTLIQWSMRKGEYRIMSKVKIIQTSAKSLFEFGGGYLGLGGIILVIGALIGMCGGVVTYSFFFLKQLKKLGLKLKSSLKKERLQRVLNRYIDFPKYSIAAGLFNRLNNHLPILYFSKYSTIVVLGHYSIAVILISIPSTIFIESILKIFYKEFAERIKNNPASAKILFIKNLLLSTGVSFILALGFYLFGKPFILFAFGNQWELASEMLPYYCWFLIASNWYIISLYIFTLLEKQKWILFSNFITLIGVVLGFFLAKNMKINDTQVIGIYIVIIFIFSFIKVSISFWLIDKYGKTAKN